MSANTLRSIASGLLLATGMTATSLNVAAAESPFGNLVGTWSGGGTAMLEGGKKESMRCKGYYTTQTGGSNLGLTIRCANAASKVELRATLAYSNGTVSGSWEERTYNQAGNLSGKADSNKMMLAISGGISGSLSVSVAGKNQQLSLSTDGTAFKGMTVSLSR